MTDILAPPSNGTVPATTLEEAQDRIRRTVEDALTGPALVEARAWARDIDVAGARRSVAAALDAHRNAQTAYRQAQGSEAEAENTHASAVGEAEWVLGDHFVSESNKTYLVVFKGDDTEHAVRRQVTADEKRAWIAAEARKQAPVREAEAALRKAKEATATARDELSHAELRVKAAGGDRDAAVAELNLLAAALPRKVTF